jgi:hypothetical protein
MGNVVGREDTFYILPSGNPRKVNRNGIDGSVGLARRVQMNWPTPTAADSERQSATYMRGNPTLLGAAQLWPTPHASMANGAGEHGEGAPNLQTAVSDWPTPKARDYRSVSGNEDRHSPDLNVAALWHTPQASDGEGSRTGVSGTSGTGRTPDGRKVSTSLQSDLRSEIGRLNPAWVCSLMGFPCGWLDIGLPDQVSPKQPGKRPGP